MCNLKFFLNFCICIIVTCLSGYCLPLMFYCIPNTIHCIPINIPIDHMFLWSAGTSHFPLGGIWYVCVTYALYKLSKWHHLGGWGLVNNNRPVGWNQLVETAIAAVAEIYYNIYSHIQELLKSKKNGIKNKYYNIDHNKLNFNWHT